MLARFSQKPNDQVTEQRNAGKYRDATLHTTSETCGQEDLLGPVSNTSPVLENGTPTLHSTSRSLIRTTDKIVAGAIQGAVRCFSVLLNRQNSVRRGRNPREKTKIDQALRSGSFEFDFCQKSPGSSIPQKNSIPASRKK